MSYQVGSVYLGSDGIKTSTTNEEIIPTSPENWTIPYKLKKFSFNNEQATKVVINGGSPIFLKAGQGFSSDIHDAPIYSFIIVDSGISYNWIGMH